MLEEKLINEEMPETDNKMKWVPWVIFVWAIGIILIILGWVIFAEAAINTRLAEHEDKDNIIQTQLAAIQTNIDWIRKTLETQSQKEIFNSK